MRRRQSSQQRQGISIDVLKDPHCSMCINIVNTRGSLCAHVISCHCVACSFLPFLHSLRLCDCDLSFASITCFSARNSRLSPIHCSFQFLSVILYTMPALPDLPDHHTPTARLQRRVSESSTYSSLRETKLRLASDKGFPLGLQSPKRRLVVPVGRVQPLGLPRAPSTTPTQILTSRLRLDRDRWRSIALQRAAQLETMEQQKQDQERTSSVLRNEISTLVTASRAVANYNPDVQMVSNTDANLTQQVDDLTIRCKKLTKSDRAKGRSLNRNLQVIVALRSLVARNRSPEEDSNDNKPALLEALAMALARIEELELHGAKVLGALESLDDTSDEGELDDEASKSITLMEAEVAFRNVLEDDTFCENKENWACLLDE